MTSRRTEQHALRALAALEARRYARHPLFLAGAALLALMTYRITRDLHTSPELGAAVTDSTFAVAFPLGLLGVFVGHALTRSLAPAADAVEAAPCDGVRRTAALCLARLVPGAVAVAWVVWVRVLLLVSPVPHSPAITTAEGSAMLLAVVPYAVGGPLVGVLVGRWTRFPAAGLLAALGLITWCVLASGGKALPVSRLGTLATLNAPFTTWTSSDGPGQPTWVQPGSPYGYLAYLCALCAVAVTGALLAEAGEGRRAGLVRAAGALVVLALVCLVLTSAPEPVRVPL